MGNSQVPRYAWPAKMDDESNGIEMLLPARAENVSLVRHAIAGSAESLGMPDEGLADLKTVVTEACMNVVQHAYDDADGPMEVRAWEETGDFVVSVTDHGHGMRPRADVSGESLHLGLSLIASMTNGFEIAGGSSIGTRVTMRLALAGRESEESGAGNGAGAHSADPGRGNGDSAQAAAQAAQLERHPSYDGKGIALLAWDLDALAPILARIVGVLAARRDMSIDELSDAVLFSDAITADINRNAPSDRIEVLLNERDTGIELRVGPLPDGGADRLRGSLVLPDELGGTLESLADAVSVDRESGGEFLVARFGQEGFSDR